MDKENYEGNGKYGVMGRTSQKLWSLWRGSFNSNYLNCIRICNPPPEFPHGLPRAFFAHTIFSLPGVMDSCIMAFRSTPAYDTHDFKKENSLVSWSFELFCLSCRGFRCFLAEQE